MAQLDELLLGVWREAGRHTDITTSTTNIAQLLARCMPLQQVLVRRIEPERSCLETVGIGTENIAPWTLGERSECHAHTPTAPSGLVSSWRSDASGSRRQECEGCWWLPCHQGSMRRSWLAHWSASMEHAGSSCCWQLPHSTLHHSISRCSRLSWSRLRQR